MPSPRVPTAPADRALDGFADLVLAGGGMKGVAYVGAIEALHAYGYRTHPRVAGTSVGAVVGAALAAGADAARIHELMDELPYRLMHDAGGGALAIDRLPIVGPLWSLRNDGGRYATDALFDWLERHVPELGGVTFGELRRARIDQMAALGVDWDPALDPLVIMATDITRGRLVQFPRDFAIYPDADGVCVDPDDALVLDALRASIAVPLYFEPVTIGGSQFVDGGLLANFAVDIFDRPSAPLQPRWPTFGFTLTSQDEAARVGEDLVDATYKVPASGAVLGAGGRVADALIGTLIVGQDVATTQRWWLAHRTIEIDTSTVGIVEFDLHEAARATLIGSGRGATTRFLRDAWPQGTSRARHGFDGRSQFPLPEQARALED